MMPTAEDFRSQRGRFAPDSLLEEAVLSELVSESQFPASWENTGNFVHLGSEGGC
jgi:hypothetical protein